MTRPQSAIHVEVSSPPDRESLVANLMVGTDEFAELNQEAGALELEIYPRRDGRPWTFDYMQLVEALSLARSRLANGPQ